MPLPRIQKGTCRVLFAYDVALAIPLEAVQARFSNLKAAAPIKHKGLAPQYFQFDPAPLRLSVEITPIAIGTRRTTATLEIALFDFGGISLSFEIPIEGEFEALLDLSCHLSEATLLREESERRVRALLDLISPIVPNVNLAPITEDYLIFGIEQFETPLSPDELAERHAAQVAQLLRSERDPLSREEIADALHNRVSFGLHDVALIDWNAALLVDAEPDDVRAVLEFANLQLLEMRFLDSQLDRSLDRSFEFLQRPRTVGRLRFPGSPGNELRRVAQMQVDGAILFERVGNAIKLLGDQYLARVYRQASQRFRLPEWNSSILRKLDTIDSIYQKAHDHSMGLRMEVLEWIVILLIAFEIVLSLLPAHP
jgi:hypothetical protein